MYGLRRQKEITDKVIDRIARVYRQSLLADRIDRLTSSQPAICNLLQRHKQTVGALERWMSALGKSGARNLSLASQKIVSGKIPDILFSLVNEVAAIESNFKNSKEESSHQVPSHGDLILEVKSTLKHFPNLEYVNGVVSVETEYITLSDGCESVELGRFRISFDLAIPLATKTLGEVMTIEAIDPNPAACNQDYVHPHIDGDEVCTGDGGDLMYAALMEGRLEDAFTLVETFLNTYNPISPYVELSDWSGAWCKNCERSYDAGDGYECERCGQDLCSSCVVHCSEHERWICPGCAGWCTLCGETACDECIQYCDSCNTDVCRDCSSGCVDCGNTVCDKCSRDCDDCRETCCQDCLCTCEECNEDYCERCRSKCDYCDRTICSKCSSKCDDCRSNICGDCRDECSRCYNNLCDKCSVKCENCSQFMCEHCYDREPCSLFREKIDA